MAPTRLQLVKALLSRGYFPKELPPPFQTTQFAMRISKVSRMWDAYISTQPRKDRDKFPLASVPCPYDLARRGHSRRMLSLVNPVNQYFLSSAIVEKYSELTKFGDKARFSVTRAKIDLNADRSVPIPAFSEMAEVRLKAYATKGYILSTDIGSCYHSMYTHAIPWALHGKQNAKKNRWSHDPSFYGNKLDFLVRQCQDGQTKGIPVGPDTSRILSEMVLTAIDARVDASRGRKIAAGYRYIDDIFYCFSSLQDAEEVLADVREAAHHFELELNPAKTSVQGALQFNEEIWPHKVAATRIRRGAKSQRLSLFAYFSSMIDIAAKYSSESIAVYAIKATTTVAISEKNWDIYEAFLVRVSREYTNTVDLVVKIICTYAAMGYPVSSSIDEWVSGIIITHVPANHHFEVAWAIWAAVSLRRKLSTEAVEVISKTDNPVCALLALHAQEAKLCAKPLDTSKWFANLSPESFYEDRWLLIYEAILKGWLARPPSEMINAPFFGALLSNKVSFYATSARNIPVDLPMIQFSLRQSVRRSKSSVLPGNIYVPRKLTRDPVPVDRMRGSYGEDGEFEDVEDFDEGPF